MPARLRFRDIRSTSTFRLSVLFGAIFVAGMIALLALVYVQTARELTARSDRILRAQAAALLAVTPERLPRVIADANAGSPANLSYAALFAADGERVTGNLTLPPALRPDLPADARDRATGRPVRLLAVRTAGGETVVVGRDVGQIAGLRRTILAILLWTGGAVVAAGFAIGVALSLRPLRRVQSLAAAAREIGRGDFTVRMPLAGRRDELDTFARTVNEMIEQVERVVGQVKIVTDAVAHDLRTPLGRLRTRLHTLSRDEDGGGGATDMLADLDLVLDRFTALLRISELEAATGEARFAAVDLAALLTSVADLYGPLADERDQRLSVASAASATVDGDGELLFEAIGNLVDNAIKFTPVGGTITLELAAAVGGWRIAVCDSGPGIAAGERSAVLRRFHRGQHAAGVPGSGLGLSIVAAIAHLHRADLALADAAPGLCVRLTLPSREAR
jgi:signal transduction histidine kinase